MNLNQFVVHSAGIGAAIGTGLPIIAAIVLRPHWSAKAKHWIVAVLAMVSGVGAVAAQGGFATSSSPFALLAAAGAVYGASQAAYAALWRPTGIAPAIETATSPVRPVPLEPMIALTDPTATEDDGTLNSTPTRAT